MGLMLVPNRPKPSRREPCPRPPAANLRHPLPPTHASAAATVQSHLVGRPVRGFFVRKKAKEHGARLRIEGLAADESLKGCRVAIIDDVCTTGGSSIQAVEEVREAGGEVVLALAVVDREEG